MVFSSPRNVPEVGLISGQIISIFGLHHPNKTMAKPGKETAEPDNTMAKSGKPRKPLTTPWQNKKISLKTDTTMSKTTSTTYHGCFQTGFFGHRDQSLASWEGVLYLKSVSSAPGVIAAAKAREGEWVPGASTIHHPPTIQHPPSAHHPTSTIRPPSTQVGSKALSVALLGKAFFYLPLFQKLPRMGAGF